MGCAACLFLLSSSICSGPLFAPSRLLRASPERPSSVWDTSRKDQKPRGPRPSSQRRPQLASTWGHRVPPGPWTATRARLPRGDPSRLPQPPPHTHRGAPSCDLDMDAGSTLTPAAAAAAAEGWTSPTPSPHGPRTPGRTAAPVATASTARAATAPPHPVLSPPSRPRPAPGRPAHWPASLEGGAQQPAAGGAAAGAHAQEARCQLHQSPHCP